MKKIFLFIAILFTLKSEAAFNPKVSPFNKLFDEFLEQQSWVTTGATDVVNYETDLTTLGYSTNAAGNGTTDDAAAINWGNSYCSAHHKTGYLPGGDSFLVKSHISINSNLTLRTSGTGAVIKLDATFADSLAVIIASAGVSNVTIDGIHITNNHSKVQYALLQFNPYPNYNKHIRLSHMVFEEYWAKAAVQFGDAGSVNAWYDDVLFEDCTFSDGYRPGYLHITVNGSDYSQYFSAYWCAGINLGNCCLGVTINNSTFNTLSGDAVYQNGASQAMIANVKYMRTIINYCDFEKVNMAAELNGSFAGWAVNVSHCHVRWPYLYGFSISCYRIIYDDDDFLTASRGFIESTSTDGGIYNCTGKMQCWKNNDSCGYQNIVPVSGSNRTHFFELNGYNWKVHGNNFVADHTNPDVNDYAEFDVGSLEGKNSEQVQTNQTTVYLGKSDNAFLYDISGNTFVGFTNWLLDATNPAHTIDQVKFSENVAITNMDSSTLININGTGWDLERNTFNLCNMAPQGGKTGGTAVIKIWYTFTGKPNATVKDNIIVGPNGTDGQPAWKTYSMLPSAYNTIYKLYQ